MNCSPRQLACEILLRVLRTPVFADQALDQTLRSSGLAAADRGLLTELVYGVLRRQGSLDYLIDRTASQKSGKLQHPVLVLLRLGIYQLLYLDRIPPAAAVHETVALAKQLAPRAAGFVNAVLRSVDRQRQQLPWPERQDDPAGYLVARYGHPRWLVEAWQRQLADEAEACAAAMAEAAPLTLRVNRRRHDRQGVLQHFAAAGIAARATRYAPDGIVVTAGGSPVQLPGFAEGWWTVQDEAAQLVGLLLDPQPGERVLDACAAPGGKATQLAELQDDQGTVLAADRSAARLPAVSATARRLGLSSLQPLVLDAARPGLAPASFDRVLVDAPCSGLGVLRRNPEVKWRRQPGDAAARAILQGEILRGVAPLVKPGGVLVYAVCSTDPAEGEEVVAEFRSAHPDFVLEQGQMLFPGWRELWTPAGMLRSWPHRDGMDGFFAARLQRR